MKKYLIALSLTCSLFAANEFTPPRSHLRPLPEAKKEPKALFSGDFLYWIPEIEGLTYANQTTASQQASSLPLDIQGTWEPGLRISAGYLFDEKGWDTLFNWTYFKSDSSASATSEKGRLTLPILSKNRFFANAVDSAKGKWHLNQNLADIEVGKNFSIGDSFQTRPFFGVRGARIENKEQASYTINNPLIPSSSTVSSKNCYIGAGPRLGASATYTVGKGIGFFILGTASTLFGSLDSKPVKSQGLNFVSNYQMEIGGQWKRSFQNKYLLAFQVAWEQNFFSNIARPLFYNEPAKNEGVFVENSDLTLKGLTTSCQLNF